MRIIFSFLLLLYFSSCSWAVEKSSIEKAVRNYFETQLPATASDLQISFKSYPQKLIELPDGLKLEVQSDLPLSLRKRITLKIAAVDSTGQRTQAYITTHLALVKNAVCSKGVIGRGEELNSGNCEIAPVDIIDFSGQPVADLNQLPGRRALKNYNRGDAIDLNYTEPIPLVLKGEKIKIVADTGNLKVTADGVAREDGSPGDLIRVRNSQSGKTISGRVVSEGIVEVFY